LQKAEGEEGSQEREQKEGGKSIFVSSVYLHDNITNVIMRKFFMILSILEEFTF
jgi:hypothetical protein